MKHIFQTLTLIIFVVIIGIFNVNAQKQKGLEIGTNIGISLAGVVAPGENNTGTRVTYNNGVSGEYYFSDRWGVKLKVIWDNKGYSNGTIIDKNDNTLITDINLNYITIPFMANWHFSKHRRWYLSFGPYLGLLTSAKDSELGEDIKNQMNGSDYGYAFCLGYKYEITNNTKLFLECDGQYGLKNIIAGDYRVWSTRGAYNFGVLINL
ncbi:porin family protein [Maribellus sediminis]|uniref:porin family protein n=1 Tax=Maribellus sediminis TaxID=2696285 RepID=UPI00142F60D7|nr:porin family protein [Maribellus sediminis]